TAHRRADHRFLWSAGMAVDRPPKPMKSFTAHVGQTIVFRGLPGCAPASLADSEVLTRRVGPRTRSSNVEADRSHKVEGIAMLHDSFTQPVIANREEQILALGREGDLRAFL